MSAAARSKPGRVVSTADVPLTEAEAPTEAEPTGISEEVMGLGCEQPEAASAIAKMVELRMVPIVDQTRLPLKKGSHTARRGTYPIHAMKYLLGSLYLIPIVGIGLKFAGC